MRKLLVILILCSILIIGCGQDTVTVTENHSASQVVEDYLIYSSANKWDEVKPLLSGQALYETQKNIDKVTNTETLITKHIVITWSAESLAEVYADVTKNTKQGDDRIAYKFSLIKVGKDWKIFKTDLADFQRPELKLEDLPPEVIKTIENYFTLTTSEKRNQDTKYLAGKLLRVSLTAKQVQGSKQNTPETTQKVLSIDSVGVADDYVVAEVFFEDKGVKASAIIDLIKVGKDWKIVQLDIAK